MHPNRAALVNPKTFACPLHSSGNARQSSYHECNDFRNIESHQSILAVFSPPAKSFWITSSKSESMSHLQNVIINAIVNLKSEGIPRNHGFSEVGGCAKAASRIARLTIIAAADEWVGPSFLNVKINPRKTHVWSHTNKNSTWSTESEKNSKIRRLRSQCESNYLGNILADEVPVLRSRNEEPIDCYPLWWSYKRGATQFETRS